MSACRRPRVWAGLPAIEPRATVQSTIAKVAAAGPARHTRRQTTAYVDYCAFTGTVGGTATFNPSVDIGQSFKTGAAGPFMLTAVKLKIYNSAGCTSGCTLRLQLWSASNTDGKPASLLYTQDFSPTLTGEAAGGCLGGAHCLAWPAG